jgi:hypothetical protein
MMMDHAAFRSIYLVVLLGGLALSGCNDELTQACTELCKQRINCEKELGNAPPSQGSCETACIGLHQTDDFVEKSDACQNKASCEYVACASP